MAIFNPFTANAKKWTDVLTGGKGNIGEFNRQKLLWEGRAEAKRLNNRVTALETNQKRIAKGISPTSETAVGTNAPQKSASEKLINPLNVKNINITQVYAGNTKKDVAFAQRISEKNTKLLEQFNKSTKEIAKNTKKTVKQDTKIKKDTFLAKAKSKFDNAKGVVLAVAKASQGALGTIWEKMKELMPTLVLASIAGILGVGVGLVKKAFKGVVNKYKNVRDKYKQKAGQKARDLKIRGWIYDKVRPVRARVRANEVRISRLEKALALCCGRNKRKQNRRVKNNRQNRQNKNSRNPRNSNTNKKPYSGTRRELPKKSFKDNFKNSIKNSKTVIKEISAKAAKQGGWLKWLFKGVGKYGLKVLLWIVGGAITLVTGGLGAIVIWIFELMFTLWLVYDIIAFSAEALGIDPIYFEKFENWLSENWSKLKNIATEKFISLAGRAPMIIGNNVLSGIQTLTANTPAENAIRSSNRRLTRTSNNIEIIREKLQTSTGSESQRLRKHLLRLDTDYTKYAKSAGLSGNAIYYASTINVIGFDFWTTDEEIQKARNIYLNQLKMAKDEKSGLNIKRNVINEKTSSIKISSPMKIGTGASKNIKTSFSLLSGGGGGGSSYGGPAQLGSKVNGLWPAAWSGLLVDEGYRKVIDYIENGNTGDYNLKGNRSSAYGRYQFIPVTAIEYARKARIIGDWREPQNQDIIFQQLTEDNIKSIRSKNVEVNILSLWIAHNLGPGAVPYMMGKTTKPWSSNSKSHINKQLPGSGGATLEAAKEMYLAKYNGIINKIISGTASQTMTNIKTGNLPGSSSGSSFGGTASSGANITGMQDAGSITFAKGGGLASAAGNYVNNISYVFGSGRDGKGNVLLNGATSYDCSSFVAMVVEKELGIPSRIFGGDTKAQYKYLTNSVNAMRVVNEKDAQSGDIIMFFWDGNGPDHVGIVTGYMAMIHNSSRAKKVISAKWGGNPSNRQIFRLKNNSQTQNVKTSAPSQFGNVAVINNSAANALQNIALPKNASQMEKESAETKASINNMMNTLNNLVLNNTTQAADSGNIDGIKVLPDNN